MSEIVLNSDPNDGQALNTRPRNMNKDRFFIDLKYIPEEAFPLFDDIGVRCDQANLYHFLKKTHPQVVKTMLSLNPPVLLSNLPKWKPGRGICLGEGGTDRRLVSRSGNFECHFYDCERFCIDHDRVPRDALSLLGNLDVRLSGPNCDEKMWHFPQYHLAAFEKAMQMFVAIKDDPSLRSILEPIAIKADGTIKPKSTKKVVPIPVHILNIERFYVELKYILPWAYEPLLMIKSSHHEKRQIWHFDNASYYTVKSIFAQLNPPEVLGYVPGLTMEEWKSKVQVWWPSTLLRLQKRGLVLLPKIPLTTQNQPPIIGRSSVTSSIATPDNQFSPTTTEDTNCNPLQNENLTVHTNLVQLSMQPRVILQKPSSQTNLLGTHIIKSVPGFAIIDNLTPDTIFERKSDGVYATEMKLTFPHPPNNVIPHSGVLFRFVHSLLGVQVRNCNLKLQVTIADFEGEDELTLQKIGSGFDLDISNHISWNQENTIFLTVEVDPALSYFKSTFMLFIGVARNLDSRELLEELRRGPRLSAENTIEMVKMVLDESKKSGILTDDSKLTLSLICPLGNSRIETPCRSTYCNHCSCFDATNFFNFYAESPKWICPICSSKISMDDLRIDGFLEMILKDEQVENADNSVVAIGRSGYFTIYSTGHQCKSNSENIIQTNDSIAGNAEREIEEMNWTPFGSDSDDSIDINSDSARENNEAPKKEPGPFVKKEFVRKKTKHSDDSDFESESPEPKKGKTGQRPTQGGFNR